MSDALPISPAAERNSGPICDVLRTVLPTSGTIVEIASGTGQHVCYFAEAFPELGWQPSDADADALAITQARVAAAGLQNVAMPVMIDARAQAWPIARADALLAINMVHISPWEATEGLFRGGARVLPAQAPLILYGPYRRKGIETAPSNEAFDRSLKARDPSWGLRLLEDVTALAERSGFALDRVVEMPANNLTIVYRRN